MARGPEAADALSPRPRPDLEALNIVLDEELQTLDLPLGVQNPSCSSGATVSLSHAPDSGIVLVAPDASCEIAAAQIRLSKPIPVRLVSTGMDRK